MARRKTKKKKPEKEKFEVPIKDEVIHTVIAIVLFAIALLLLLSSVDLAGILGEKIYLGLKHLFGIGYFLFPLILVLLGSSYLKIEKPEMNWFRLIGAIFVLLSGLAI